MLRSTSRPGPSSVAVILALSAVLIAACEARSGATTSGSQVVERDSAGVRVVHNGAAPGLLGDSLGVREVFRIGGPDAEGPFQFHQISDLVVGPSGDIFVANQQTVTVRVFSAEGGFVTEFGGRGGGPGEIRSMANDLIPAGDHLVVADWQRGGMMHLFTWSGDFVESWPTRSDPIRYDPLGWDPEGSFIVATYDNLNDVEGGANVQISRIGLRRVLPSDRSPGPIFLSHERNRLYSATGSEGGRDWGLFSHERSPLVVGPGGGIFVSRGFPYRIEIHGADGRLERVVTRDLRGDPISDQDVEEYRGLVMEFYDTLSTLVDEGSRAQRRRNALDRLERQAGFPRPDTAAITRAILVAGDSSFWVERVDGRSPASLEFENAYGSGIVLRGGAPSYPTRWDLFTPEGRFRGTVTLPARFRPLWLDDLEVTGVLLDDLDVEHVARFEVVTGG